MKRLFLILVLSLLISGLLFDWGKPAPAQTPRDKVAININSMKFGGSGYVACFALSEIINKHSPLLQATVIETPGTLANLKTFLEEPKKRKDSLGYGTWASNYLAVNAVPPFFKVSYKGARAISLAQWVAHTYVATDPKIKTPMDFVGKRIGLPPKGSAGTMDPEMLLKYGWEIFDKVKIHYLGWTESIQALRDGMVDVAICNPIYIGVDKVAPSPALDELKALRIPYHYIPFPKEDVIRAREKSGFPLFPTVLPPGALGPEQREPFPCSRFANGWFADVEMSDDLVYEVCRMIYENYKEFWPYHVSMKGLYPEYMPKLAATEAEYHPGAIKFYKEKGLKIGISD